MEIYLIAFLKILDLISALFKTFKTTTSEKIIKAKKTMRKKIDHYKKTGRPKW